MVDRSCIIDTPDNVRHEYFVDSLYHSSHHSQVTTLLQKQEVISLTCPQLPVGVYICVMACVVCVCVCVCVWCVRVHVCSVYVCVCVCVCVSE